MTTIPRDHTKRVMAVLDTVTTCGVFRLDNNFVGNQCEPKYAREALRTNHDARLIAREGAAMAGHECEWRSPRDEREAATDRLVSTRSSARRSTPGVMPTLWALPVIRHDCPPMLRAGLR